MAVFHGTKHDDIFNESSDTGSDTFDLYKGGEDTVIAGTGDDIINMGASLDAGDRLNGGGGNDVVVLHGDYSAGIVFDDQTIQNIEALRLRAGFDYILTTADGNVAAGARLIVNARTLGSANHLTFDGSAETDGHFLVYGGAGDDTITGGARADVFHLESGGNDTAHGGDGNDTFLLGGALTASDQIDGGAGSDTLELNGEYALGGALTFGQNTITNVETLKFDNGHRYQITTNDGNVASGQTLTVDFSAMTSKQFVFNGSAELDGNFRFVFGAANVLLHGGNGNDIFDATHAGNASVELYGNGGDDTFLVGADFNHILVFSLDGGSGNDTIEFNGDYPSLVEIGIETTSIETIRFDGGHTYSNVVVAEPGAATIDASQVSTLFHLAFTNGNYTIEVGSGGMIASPYDSSSQDDTFIVTSEASLAASTLDAGNGSDTLELNGDFSIAFGASTIAGIETITVAAGHNYNLSSNDANLAAGATLTVDASALTSSFALDFGGGAETDGHFAFIGGAGADLLSGGSQSDTFDLSLSDGAFVSGGGGNDTFTVTTAAHLLDDFIDGGTGTDTLVLNGDFSTQTALTGSNLVSIDALQLAGGSNSYNLTFADGIATSLSIDASAAASLTFSGAGDTSTTFTITGSAGDDHIIGGNKGDTITGGGGADIFAYTSVAQSTGLTFDTITDFTAGTDKFDLSTTVTGIFAVSGSVNSATFDSDLNTLHALQFDGATIVTVTAGDLSGHTLLVIDGNGDDTYSSGQDYVIDITHYTGTITTGDFI